MNIRYATMACCLLVMTLWTIGAAATLKAPELEWKTVTEALNESAKLKKKVVVDIYTDWCGWCKRMDRDTYMNEDVVQYMHGKWIAAKINPERADSVVYNDKAYPNAQFCSALGATGYPTTAFFDETGALLTIVSGYVGPEDFLRILKYFGEDIYKTKKWEEYAK